MVFQISNEIEFHFLIFTFVFLPQFTLQMTENIFPITKFFFCANVSQVGFDSRTLSGTIRRYGDCPISAKIPQIDESILCTGKDRIYEIVGLQYRYYSTDFIAENQSKVFLTNMKISQKYFGSYHRTFAAEAFYVFLPLW